MSCGNPFFFISTTNQFDSQVNERDSGDPVLNAAVIAKVLSSSGADFIGPFVATNEGEGKYTVIIDATSAANLVDGTEYIYQTVTTSGTRQVTTRINGTAGYSRN